MTVSLVMPCRIELATRRMDHAVPDEEQVLAGAFAHAAIGAESDAFRESETLGFHADELAREVVAGGLAECRDRVGSQPLPGRHADVDAVLEPVGAEVGTPFPGRHRNLDRRVDLRRHANLA
jgi:hypothetical protein